MPKILITLQTAAATSDYFIVGHGVNKDVADLLVDKEVTVIAVGLAGSETIDIQISHDGGITFNNLYESGGQIQLTTTVSAITIQGPGIFRLNKGITAGAVAAYASTPSRP